MHKEACKGTCTIRDSMEAMSTVDPRAAAVSADLEAFMYLAGHHIVEYMR